MWFLEGVAIAFQSIWANRLRSILTLIGIIIGVTTVIAVVSIINGMNNYVAVRINSIGSNTIILDKFGLITSEEDWLNARKNKNLTVEDMDAIAQNCNLVNTVGGSVYNQTTVKFGSSYLEDILIVGTTPNYTEVSDIDVDYGRAFNENDNTHHAAVCMVGPDIVANLFKYDSPVGKDIKVGNYFFRVIGVSTARGSFLGNNQDNWVAIPLTTYEKCFGRRRSVQIHAKAIDLTVLSDAQDQIRGLMRARHRIKYDQKDDFGMMTAGSFMDLYNNFTRVAWLVLVLISSISLIVGGIVIMNIMLVSVTERTREIGIRKAIGAKRRDILWQFLVESVTLSIIGVAIGVIGGIALALVIGKVSPLPAAIETWAVLSGLGVASSVGIIFGIFPAMKAAKLDPIEALRYE